mgnify:CR=1 FL=1
MPDHQVTIEQREVIFQLHDSGTGPTKKLAQQTDHSCTNKTRRYDKDHHPVFDSRGCVQDEAEHVLLAVERRFVRRRGIADDESAPLNGRGAPVGSSHSPNCQISWVAD